MRTRIAAIRRNWWFRQVAPVAVLAAGAVLAITGCDRLVGDHTSPVMVQDPNADPYQLGPGLWTATPPNSVDGCHYSVMRDGYPVLVTEVDDSLPVYVWLPQSGDSDYGLTTVGCGTWTRVTS